MLLSLRQGDHQIKTLKADYVPSADVMPSFGKVILRQSKSNETETAMDELVQHATRTSCIEINAAYPVSLKPLP